MKPYVTDGDCNYTEWNIPSEIVQLSDNYYQMNGNFTDVPFRANHTTLGFEEDIIGIKRFRCLVVDKTANSMKFYTPENIPNQSIDEFYMQISIGHAIGCRNHLIYELNGIVPEENVYVGTIGLSFNLLGIAKAFNIDIISASKSGMTDSYNEKYGIPFKEVDKLIVNAHGTNAHVPHNHTTYIGEIVTVSYGDNTGVNQGSYGAGLEFLVNEQNCQSYATPRIAGMFAKLKIITGKSYDKIREALRKTASFGDNWTELNGFGGVDYEKALAELTETPEKPDIPPVLNQTTYIIELKPKGWLLGFKKEYILLTERRDKAITFTSKRKVMGMLEHITVLYPNAKYEVLK